MAAALAQFQLVARPAPTVSSRKSTDNRFKRTAFTLAQSRSALQVNAPVGFGLISSILGSGIARAEELDTVVTNFEDTVVTSLDSVSASASEASDAVIVGLNGLEASLSDSALVPSLDSVRASASDVSDVVLEGLNGVEASLSVAFGSIWDIVSGNPELVAGAVTAVLFPVLISLVLKKGYSGNLSPTDGLKFLAEEGAVLIDVRSTSSRSDGSPSLKSLKKKPVNISYRVEDGEVFFADPEFSTKVLAVKGLEKGSKIAIIDKSGESSVEAAKDLTKAGFNSVFVISGGTEKWQADGLPWLKPSSSFKLDLGVITDALSSSVQDNGLVTTSLGVAAAVGASALLASEAELALEVLGLAAVAQVFLKKFLFAKDRKQTLAQIKTFLDTQVAPKELVEDFQEIAGALLPQAFQNSSKSSSDSATAPEPVPEAAVAPEVSSPDSPPAVSADSPLPAPEPAPETAPEAAPIPAHAPPAVSSTDFPPAPRPLSPYATYPDLKPPTSPTPSKP